MPGFSVLLDAPAEAGRRQQIAKLGTFKDDRYGEFTIDQAEVDSWKRNLARLPGGKALIDFDHKSQRRPRDSRAAGWITAIEVDGDRVLADTEWTPAGEQALRNGEYRFFSPVFGRFKDETGTEYPSTLSSGALTNTPFLGSMPALMLASDERLQDRLEELDAVDERARLLETLTSTARSNLNDSDFALPGRRYPIHDVSHARNALARVAQNGTSDEQAKVRAAVYRKYPQLRKKEADSRAPMDDKLLRLLDLEDDADDTTVLEAITALKAKADTPAEPKTLDQLAKEDGKIVLDKDAFDSLKAGAEAGAQAKAELREQRFETAFTKALDNGKAVPAEKDDLKGFYELDADRTLKVLEDREPIVKVTPTGEPVRVDQPAPSGVADHDLHQLVLDRMEKNGKSIAEPGVYQKTLETLMAEAVNGG